MKKVCIFKCEGSNMGLIRVVRFEIENGMIYFKVMRNRRGVGSFPIYSEALNAIDEAVRLAKGDYVLKASLLKQ